ncbi:hypothetical protein RHSIM_Rhsim02G0201700 [Rhododendron simsii]|uniref:Uncharacterized protein n=1 Tax=Rhododendron simsii TaxID=118357 RepID=A0A834H9A6_RHOSS|nr:hypothetical protein RHSIM_Rhsim02G0201700 [Rhododendron simsii]
MSTLPPTMATSSPMVRSLRSQPVAMDNGYPGGEISLIWSSDMWVVDHKIKEKPFLGMTDVEDDKNLNGDVASFSASHWTVIIPFGYNAS